MIRFERLRRSPRVLAHLTGLSREAFVRLLPAFAEAWEEFRQQQDARRTQAGQPRRRRRGGGRKPVLATPEDQLLFVLFYFRQYPTQETLAFLFGFTQGPACEWIHKLTPVVNRALGRQLELPAREPRSLALLLAECPELEFLIDGTERPIRRPQDKQRQKDYYSGKTKRHTKKNVLVTEKRTGKVKGLGRTQPGRRHDKAVADEEQYEFPEGSRLWQDTGFQGYRPAGVTTVQPKKKPRGKPLTPADKVTNRQIARERVRVEHSIGGVKVFRIVHDIYRNLKEGFDDLVMETACGLFNFRVSVSSTK